MILCDFIKHIKHTSVEIKVINAEECHDIYNGTIGTYLNWIHKNEYDKSEIDLISFTKDVMHIFIIVGD